MGNDYSVTSCVHAVMKMRLSKYIMRITYLRPLSMTAKTHQIDAAYVNEDDMGKWAAHYHTRKAKEYEHKILHEVAGLPAHEQEQAIKSHPDYAEYKHHVDHAVKFTQHPESFYEDEDDVNDERVLDELADEYMEAAVITVCENIWDNEEPEYEEETAGKSPLAEEVDGDMLEESVRVSHDAYLRSHGKHPRGTGNWMIGIGTDDPNYDNEGKVPITGH